MWPNPQKTADLVKFTEEILNEKLHFLCSVYFTYEILYSSLLKFLLLIKFFWYFFPAVYAYSKDSF